MYKLKRRDIIKGLATIPLLGYFALAFKSNINKNLIQKSDNSLEPLRINRLDAPAQKLRPPTGDRANKLRIGLVGIGWRGEALLLSLGFAHPDVIRENTVQGKYNAYFRRTYVDNEDLNIEITAVCDVFEVHAERGALISQNYIRNGSSQIKNKPAKIYPSYRDLIASGEVDAVIIATSDHTHVPIAIEAAGKGLPIYVEKPMAHSIEDAVRLKDTIKSTDVVFQLGHQNRQQMSYKIARELYRKDALGIVNMVQTYTNRNTVFGAWIRDDAFDHKLGNKNNIDWKEFLHDAPWHEFDLKRFFSWQRYSDYGTSLTGNDFTHQYDAINQILNLGIPETVVATGGQYYYKHHGDMPDVFNSVFNYPERGLTLTYNGTLKNDVYQQSRILGSEATMDVDRAVMLYRNQNSERYKNIQTDPSDPLYYYAPDSDVDAVSSATSKVYMQGGYGPTFIDGRMADATFLHLKEWVDAIRGHGRTSCSIDRGFEEAVTFNLANMAYVHKKPVKWDRNLEKVIIG